MQTEATSYLLRELGEAKRENRELRSRVRLLTRQRDLWREESRAWKWGFAQVEKAARRGEDAQTSGRAEAS